MVFFTYCNPICVIHLETIALQVINLILVRHCMNSTAYMKHNSLQTLLLISVET